MQHCNRDMSDPPQGRETTEGEEFVLHPPVDGYATLQWSALNEAEACGYDYIKPLIDKWWEEKVRLIDTSHCTAD